MPDSWSDFWQSVWDGLGGGVYAGQQATARNLANDRARAVGFDTSTGTFVAPQYADTFAKLHPGQDPTNYIEAQRQEVSTEYLSGYESAFESNGGFSFLPFSPAAGGDARILDRLKVPGLEDLGISSNLLILALFLGFGFLVVKAVK